MKQAWPLIGSIRHFGMMFGIEIINPETGQKDGETAMKILDLALEEGVLFYFCGNEGEVLRMIPPLTISTEEIDEGLVKLSNALKLYNMEKNKRLFMRLFFFVHTGLVMNILTRSLLKKVEGVYVRQN
ncbi:siderophore biosynthesis diaminobutyrate-2-oxoglutarate aminotransferase [Bacillus sp. JCM 19046]|nr:siderophore biosynthesis diaminobutyrate-2-oxoglutarate aminotransferase [Bacillus sp. JCM 19046]